MVLLLGTFLAKLLSPDLWLFGILAGFRSRRLWQIALWAAGAALVNELILQAVHVVRTVSLLSPLMSMLVAFGIGWAIMAWRARKRSDA